MLLGIIGWLVVGLVIGFVASKMVDLHGDDPRLGVGVAAGGAIPGRRLYSVFSGNGVSAWNPWCSAVAALARSWARRSGTASGRVVSTERQTRRSSY